MIDRKYFTINLVIFDLSWDTSDSRWNTNLEFIFTFVHSHDLLQTSLNIFKCCVSTHYWHNHGNHSDIRQWSERLICTFNKLIIKWICVFSRIKTKRKTEIYALDKIPRRTICLFNGYLISPIFGNLKYGVCACILLLPDNRSRCHKMRWSLFTIHHFFRKLFLLLITMYNMARVLSVNLAVNM